MTLVDTSVWIDYFHNGITADVVDVLIEENKLCTNDVILAELIPSINHRREFELKELLLSVPKLQLRINWGGLVSMQTENLRNGPAAGVPPPRGGYPSAPRPGYCPPGAGAQC